MEKTKVIDIVNGLIDKTSARNASKLIINTNRASDLRRKCRIIDELMDEYDGVYSEIKMNYDSLVIKIMFACTMFEWCKGDNRAVQLFNVSSGVSFFPGDEESVEITIMIPSIWDDIAQN